MAGDFAAGCLRSSEMTRPDTRLGFLLLLEGTGKGAPAGGPVEGEPAGKGEVPCEGARVAESDSRPRGSEGRGRRYCEVSGASLNPTVRRYIPDSALPETGLPRSSGHLPGLEPSPRGQKNLGFFAGQLVRSTLLKKAA